MTLLDAQRKAIQQNAAETAEFDLVTRGSRSRCRFQDAGMGIFVVLDRPARLVGRSLLVNDLADDDGFTVENFTVPGPPVVGTGMEQLRRKIEQLRDRHRPWEGHEQTDAFIEAVLAVEEIRVTWALGALKDLGDELDAARAENERLRSACEQLYAEGLADTPDRMRLVEIFGRAPVRDR